MLEKGLPYLTLCPCPLCPTALQTQKIRKFRVRFFFFFFWFPLRSEDRGKCRVFFFLFKGMGDNHKYSTYIERKMDFKIQIFRL